MHQPVHDSTEDALLEATSNWYYWEGQCEFWRKQYLAARQQLDVAIARAKRAEIALDLRGQGWS